MPSTVLLVKTDVTRPLPLKSLDRCDARNLVAWQARVLVRDTMMFAMDGLMTCEIRRTLRHLQRLFASEMEEVVSDEIDRMCNVVDLA